MSFHVLCQIKRFHANDLEKSEKEMKIIKCSRRKNFVWSSFIPVLTSIYLNFHINAFMQWTEKKLIFVNIKQNEEKYLHMNSCL